jgi:hypothetical protein
MDYGWLNVIALVLGVYIKSREDHRKKDRRPQDQEQRPTRYCWISDRDFQATESGVDAGQSSGDGDGGAWDLGGWDD